MTDTTRRWKFFKAGGVDQVMLRDGADVVALDGLDQKLWVALAMPTRGVEFDPRTLDVLDTDKDGRVRAPEIVAAVRWVKEAFKDPSDLLKGGDGVALSAIKDPVIAAAARRLLDGLGKKTADKVTVADVNDTAKAFAATTLNGDGVVTTDSTGDADLKKVLEGIASCVGTVNDRSGKPGVDKAKADAFFAEARSLVEWSAKSKTDRTILPLGEKTAAAMEIVQAIKVKVEDFFARCRLAAFDARAAGPLNRTEADYAAMADKDLSFTHEAIAKLPLTKIESGRVLPLTGGALNPVWAKHVADLGSKVIGPLLDPGKHSISEADWAAALALLAPFEAWQAAKPKTSVEKLGLDYVKTMMSQGAEQKVAELIASDLALEKEYAQIASVEKLVLFQRDLFRLLNNFVNFSEFYGNKGAIFQAGTLYLDGRSCDLCVTVADAGKHGALAGMAASFLAYCDCTRPGGEKTSIVAAFTDGDSDNLLVGRNGVFYDRKGRDWDATITKIISNPISIREAFWSPYKKLVRLVEEQVAKRAAAGEADANAKLEKTATATANVDKTKKDDVKKIDVGTVAAIGVAIGGIGAMVTGIFGSFFGLGIWMPVGVGAAILLISGPSMLMAYLKLRQRNLGPILDANGWAINGRAKINVPFGAALTHVATLPPNSERSLVDPYAEKKKPWRTYFAVALVVVLAAMWYLGKLDGLLPGPAKSTSVLGANAPAAEATAPAPLIKIGK